MNEENYFLNKLDIIKKMRRHLLFYFSGKYKIYNVELIDLAYLAGYFDADGCYNISKKYNKDGKSYYQVQIKYTGIEKDTMLWIYDKLDKMGCFPKLQIY